MQNEVLLTTHEGTIVRHFDGVIECKCEPVDLRLVIYIVVTFATIVSSIVVTLVSFGILPKALLSIVALWIGIGLLFWSILARSWKRRGRYVFDPHTAMMVQHHGRRPVGRWPLGKLRLLVARDSSATVRDPEGDRGNYAVANRWLLVDVGDGTSRIVGAGKPWQIKRAVSALEELGVLRSE